MRVAFFHRGYENIGVQMLSAVLRRAGHETRLFFDPLLFDDMLLSVKPLARAFDHTTLLIDRLAEWNPGVVCFSIVTFDYAWARRSARRIRERLPNAKIVFGGIHVTSVPDEVLSCGDADFVVVGEGEGAIVDLVAALGSGGDVGSIANVGVRGGSVRAPRPLIQDLDALPFADKALYYDEHPLFRIGYTIVSGRGCPIDCAYCHNNIQSKIYGRKGYLRRRSVENVVAELELAKTDSNPFLVRFSDDEFCYDAEWLEEFADVYPARAGMPFWCFISPGSARPRQFAALRRAGCVEMQMGVQTLDPEVRHHVIDRHETTERIAEAIDTCRSMGIRLTVDYIMNLPGHDEARLVEAAGFFAQHPPFRVHTFWLSYFPNLDITRYALEHGILTPTQMDEAWAGSSANTFFRGGTAFDASLVRTQILFLLAALRMRPLVEWLTRNGRYRRIPFVGFALYWFLTYTSSFATREKKNDLFGKRMARQYRSYVFARLRAGLAALLRPSAPIGAAPAGPAGAAWSGRP